MGKTESKKADMAAKKVENATRKTLDILGDDFYYAAVIVDKEGYAVSMFDSCDHNVNDSAVNRAANEASMNALTKAIGRVLEASLEDDSEMDNPAIRMFNVFSSVILGMAEKNEGIRNGLIEELSSLGTPAKVVKINQISN
jgi:hypothetical protein